MTSKKKNHKKFDHWIVLHLGNTLYTNRNSLSTNRIKMLREARQLERRLWNKWQCSNIKLNNCEAWYQNDIEACPPPVSAWRHKEIILKLGPWPEHTQKRTWNEVAFKAPSQAIIIPCYLLIVGVGQTDHKTDEPHNWSADQPCSMFFHVHD